jgi:sRNA-binding protein
MSKPSQQQRELASNVIGVLAGLFPKCFFVFEQHRKPLKRGIDHDIAVTMGDAITIRKLGSR